MSTIDLAVRAAFTITLAATLGGCGSGGGSSSSPPMLAAQFSAPALTPLDDIPLQVAYGDFDGDGRKDAVVALWTPGTAGYATRLVLLRGRADGSFETAQALPGLALIQSIAAVDVNRNGHLDLVALGCAASLCPDSGPGVFVFLGNGAGAFASPVAYATGLGPNAAAIAIGDFNGDGAPDIAVGRVNVAVLLGNGDGTFKPPTIWAAGNAGVVSVVSLNAAEFTGDAKQDLLVVYSSLTELAAVLPGRGNGEFDLPIGPTVLGSFGTGVAVADFNRDGKPDLLLRVSTGPSPQFQLRLGKGDGTFADAMMVAAEAGSDLYTWTFGDLNRDGIADIVMRDIPGNVAVLYGKGDGTFMPRQSLPFTLPAASFTDSSFPRMDLVDLNGDGRLDFVTSDGKTLAVRFGTS
jgi:hypothetical protein